METIREINYAFSVIEQKLLADIEELLLEKQNINHEITELSKKCSEEGNALRRQLDEREQVTHQEIQFIQQHLSLTQKELKDSLSSQIAREREVAAQLLSIHQQADLEKVELAKKCGEKESAFLKQQSLMQQELQDTLNFQVVREREIAAQLFSIQQQADMEKVEIAKRCGEKEGAFLKQQILIQQELQDTLNSQVVREREVAAQLFSIQQQADLEKVELAKKCGEKESAFLKQQSLMQQELQDTLSSQVVREREVAAQLLSVHQQAELEKAVLVRRHSEQLDSIHRQYGKREQDILHQLEISQRHLLTIQNTLLWKVFSPLRAIAPSIFSKINGDNIESIIVEASQPPTHSNIANQIIMEPPMSAPTEKPKLTPPNKAKDLETLLQYHDTQFIECAYLSILDRPADIEGSAYYLKRIRRGFSKIGILAQLCLSEEGAGRAINLKGLNSAIQRYRRGQYFLIGGLYRLIEGTEGENTTDRKLRVIEQNISILHEEIGIRCEKIEVALSDLSQQIIQQQPFVRDPQVETQVHHNLKGVPPKNKKDSEGDILENIHFMTVENLVAMAKELG